MVPIDTKQVVIVLCFGSQMLVVKVDDRMGLDEAVAHPWLQ